MFFVRGNIRLTLLYASVFVCAIGGGASIIVPMIKNKYGVNYYIYCYTDYGVLSGSMSESEKKSFDVQYSHIRLKACSKYSGIGDVYVRDGYSVNLDETYNIYNEKVYTVESVSSVK